MSSVQRIEVIVKMLKKGRKSQGEGGMCTKNGSYCEKEKKVSGGVRVDVNGEVKLCENSKQKKKKKIFMEK